MSGPVGNETITIRYAPLIVDPRDGTEYRDWDNAQELVVPGCSVQPFLLAEKLNFEINAEREYVRTGYRVWAPAGSPIPDAVDKIEWRSKEYEVFGHPGAWYDLEGEQDHIAFVMQLREG